jgi:hypothetical protein
MRYRMKPVRNQSGKVLRMTVEVGFTKKGMEFVKRNVPLDCMQPAEPRH